jgi:DNA-binding NarL/FixJ family response regulator
VIVEDHEIFRMGLKELINQESDLVVSGEASNIDDAWRLIKQSKSDMVIVDITLEGCNGIDLIKDINKIYPDLPLLVLSMHDESLYAQRSLFAGASGYIMKQETSESVIKAIRHILNGNLYVSEKIMSSILSQYTSNPNSSEPLQVNITLPNTLYIRAFADKAWQIGWRNLGMLVTLGGYGDMWRASCNAAWEKNGGRITEDKPANYYKETDFSAQITSTLQT